MTAPGTAPCAPPSRRPTPAAYHHDDERPGGHLHLTLGFCSVEPDPAGVAASLGIGAGVAITNDRCGHRDDLSATRPCPVDQHRRVPRADQRDGHRERRCAESVLINDNDASTATNGSPSPTTRPPSDGGAVYDDGQFWATNSHVLRQHRRPSRAVRSTTIDGSARLSGDTFTGNTAVGTRQHVQGGAIYNNDGPVAVDTTTFTSNTATNSRPGDGDGGAIYAGRRDGADERHLHRQHATANTAAATAGSAAPSTTDYGLTQVVGQHASAATAPSSNVHRRTARAVRFYDDSASPSRGRLHGQHGHQRQRRRGVRERRQWRGPQQ